jgi:type 1 fimbriae regulatory protein FimB/type 1 fimbriae regulatory protein FimE
MAKTALSLVRTESAPSTDLTTTEKRTYLTESEVEQLITAAGNNRDRCMILMAFRHGLRVSELITMQWRQLRLDDGRMDVKRLKGSDDSVQPLSGREIRMLRKIRREQPVGSRYVFISRLGAPMTRQSFDKMLRAAGAKAGLDGVHAHLLRHGCGFKLVNDGLDTISLAAYLGHRQIANTLRYCKMSATRFDGLWRD